MYSLSGCLLLALSGQSNRARVCPLLGAYACALVEERRDDPAIDRVLDTLEGLCGDLARGIRSRPQVRP
jgi:hypothetical protein